MQTRTETGRDGVSWGPMEARADWAGGHEQTKGCDTDQYRDKKWLSVLSEHVPGVIMTRAHRYVRSRYLAVL